MTRSVFDLPLRVRRSYMATIQLLDERAVASGSADASPVRDVDIAGATLLALPETRLHLLDLGNDLLEVVQDAEHVCVTGAGQGAARQPPRGLPQR